MLIGRELNDLAGDPDRRVTGGRPIDSIRCAGASLSRSPSLPNDESSCQNAVMMKGLL